MIGLDRHPTSLRELLDSHTRPMTLVEQAEGGKVRCLACAHKCLIPPGRAGVCKVRFNRQESSDSGGWLVGPWGYVSGLQNDPIEKKPFFHVLPGSKAYSFGMLGCDFHCAFCQNWLTSQTLRDPDARLPDGLAPLREILPDTLVSQALAEGALTVASTYNEPLITAEWAVDVFQSAKKAGLHTAFVCNGNNTPQAVDLLKPWLDFYKIDLKCFDERQYRKLGGTLQHVLDGILRVFQAGMWLEIVTLVVPGMNDSADELRRMARFIAGVSRDIPWHVTAFHPDYHMRDTPPTPPATLMRAYETGREEGLNFVYAGNLPGRVGNTENTLCPRCGEVMVERFGNRAVSIHLRGGCCPGCQTAIPGRWEG